MPCKFSQISFLWSFIVWASVWVTWWKWSSLSLSRLASLAFVVLYYGVNRWEYDEQSFFSFSFEKIYSNKIWNKFVTKFHSNPFSGHREHGMVNDLCGILLSVLYCWTSFHALLLWQCADHKPGNGSRVGIRFKVVYVSDKYAKRLRIYDAFGSNAVLDQRFWYNAMHFGKFCSGNKIKQDFFRSITIQKNSFINLWIWF